MTRTITEEQKSEATQLAQQQFDLANEYADLGNELIEIKMIKAIHWTELREGVKSDAQADRAWDRTEMGIREMQINSRMKINEKMISAIKTKINVMNMEAMNQY